MLRARGRCLKRGLEVRCRRANVEACCRCRDEEVWRYGDGPQACRRGDVEV